MTPYALDFSGLPPGRIPCDHARIANPSPASAVASSRGPRPASRGPRLGIGGEALPLAGRVRVDPPDPYSFSANCLAWLLPMVSPQACASWYAESPARARRAARTLVEVAERRPRRTAAQVCRRTRRPRSPPALARRPPDRAPVAAAGAAIRRTSPRQGQTLAVMAVRLGGTPFVLVAARRRRESISVGGCVPHGPSPCLFLLARRGEPAGARETAAVRAGAGCARGAVQPGATRPRALCRR
jgi:hypothetical protein